MMMGWILAFIGGAVLGWLLATARQHVRLEKELQARVKAETELAGLKSRVEDDRKILEEARARLMEAFKASAGDVLNQSNAAFLSLAQETFQKILAEARGDLGKRQEAINGLVRPLADALAKFDEHVRAMEKNREHAYAGLLNCVNTLTAAQQQLQRETASLVTALRAPQVRGRWGELTLRRVVELAGMSAHCDFTEQLSVGGADGRQRPDMVVHLPGGRDIVVDAKVALDAFLDAVSAADETARRSALARHAKQVRAHMEKLADKTYWAQFSQTPEFVVMFIPGESFFAAAVDLDHDLVAEALQRGVVLATPATLMALVRAVEYGWRQEQLTRNTQMISDLGRQLYERLRVFAEHAAEIGAGLEKAGQAYNRAVGSFEARVMPAARRFREMGLGDSREIPFLKPIETRPRQTALPESDDNQKE